MLNLRNRLPAKVTGIKMGKLNTHVTLEWESHPLSVIITSAAAEEMELKEGTELEVLFKASDVIIAKNLSGSISARNIFPGTIKEIVEGFPLALVSVIAGGCTVSAEVTLSSVKDMGLKAGDQIEVVIKSTELILGRKR